jgi:hypothetical protein
MDIVCRSLQAGGPDAFVKNTPKMKPKPNCVKLNNLDLPLFGPMYAHMQFFIKLLEDKIRPIRKNAQSGHTACKLQFSKYNFDSALAYLWLFGTFDFAICSLSIIEV